MWLYSSYGRVKIAERLPIHFDISYAKTQYMNYDKLWDCTGYPLGLKKVEVLVLITNTGVHSQSLSHRW